jgi:hypothetical protein
VVVSSSSVVDKRRAVVGPAVVEVDVEEVVSTVVEVDEVVGSGVVDVELVVGTVVVLDVVTVLLLVDDDVELAVDVLVVVVVKGDGAQRESSDVLPAGSVAVAVTHSEGSMTRVMVAVNSTWPVPSVATTYEPTSSSASPKPRPSQAAFEELDGEGGARRAVESGRSGAAGEKRVSTG